MWVDPAARLIEPRLCMAVPIGRASRRVGLSVPEDIAVNLSRFFTLAEMTRSETAAREGIPNQPAAAEIDHLRALCQTVLDPLRESLGRAIQVNSGYRGPELNRRLGGAASSQHMEGKATDIQSPGMSVLELFQSLIRLGLPFDQLIYEARNATAKWVHVSFNALGNRGEIRVAEFGPDGRPLRYPLISRQQALDMTERVSRSLRAPALEYIEMGDEPEDLGWALSPAAAPKQAPTRGKPRPSKKSARSAPGKSAAPERRPPATEATRDKPAAGGRGKTRPTAKKPRATVPKTAKRSAR